MEIKTCKGRYAGTVAECAEWLEMMQPASVRVEVECNDRTASVEVPTPRGMDSGWQSGRTLREALREAWGQASCECGEVAP
jgi:hypothetical protein